MGTNRLYTSPIKRKPRAEVGRSTTFPIPHNTNTMIEWNTDVRDAFNMHDPVTDSDDIVINEDGEWAAAIFMRVSGTDANLTRLTTDMLLNGTTQLGSIEHRGPGTFAPVLRVCYTCPSFRAVAGDIVNFRVFQTNGSSADLNVQTDSFFTVYKIGP